MKHIILAVLLLFPLAARAEKKTELKLGDEACRYLAVTYTPGIDVYGRPVVQADLSDHSGQMPEKFSFDVNVDVARAVGLPVPDGTQTLVKAGTVTYDKGALSFNGKPMEPEMEEKLKALCTEKPKSEQTKNVAD